MRLAGTMTSAVLCLAVLLTPAVVSGSATSARPPAAPAEQAEQAGRWEVSATAANIRADHSTDAAIVGIAQRGDRVDLAESWTSPLGAQWREATVHRTGVTGWIHRSLITRHPLPDPGTADCFPDFCQDLAPLG
ncbi:hypothetical protein GCM10009760_49130 [Kitasatospora kazusensis]|uniref:SH3 domain-containing protein n=1 Tax=Kitasatospora kazusensis TaxID=407974 RepID=A0ABP5LWY4_9ACTN